MVFGASMRSPVATPPGASAPRHGNRPALSPGPPATWPPLFRREKYAGFPRRFPARQSAERFGVFRDGVRLLFRFDLEPMLDATEKAVSIFENSSFAVRKQLQVREHRQYFQRAGLLEKSVPRAVQQLQRLDHKLDFANPARAQLHVPSDVLATDDVALDPPFYCADFFQDISPGKAQENQRSADWSAQIVTEDFDMLVGVQRNLNAGVYQRGPLSPKYEHAVKGFEDMVREALGDDGGLKVAAE